MPRVIDGRGMMPPEPLELALAALPELGENESMTVLVYCQPHPLFAALQEAGFTWQEEVGADGTHAVHIRRASAVRAT